MLELAIYAKIFCLLGGYVLTRVGFFQIPNTSVVLKRVLLYCQIKKKNVVNYVVCIRDIFGEQTQNLLNMLR